MDSEKFDTLIRRFSQTRTRRSLVVGSLAATVLGAIGLSEAADARSNKNRGKGKGKGKGKGHGGGNGNGGGKNDKRTICHCPDGDVNKCKTLRVGGKAAQAHLRNHCDYAGECRDDVVNPCEPDDDCLAVVDTEGNVERESDGTFTATTDGDEAFGNLVFGVPAGTTFAELESLGSAFDFEEGTCGGGSPRFVVFLENNRCPYAQFPPAGCDTAGEAGDTGNLIGNNEPFVWNDDLCGGDATNNTYDEVLADYGGVVIESIVLVVDESPTPGTKTVNLDPCITVASDDN